MYGNGLTLLVSKRFEGPQSPPVESERWWLEMARRKKQAATGPGRQATSGRAAGSVGVFGSRPGHRPDAGPWLPSRFRRRS